MTPSFQLPLFSLKTPLEMMPCNIKSITDGKEEVAKAKLAEKASANVYVPTIQQRITETNTAIEESCE